jgi:hypothetical protein
MPLMNAAPSIDMRGGGQPIVAGFVQTSMLFPASGTGEARGASFLKMSNAFFEVLALQAGFHLLVRDRDRLAERLQGRFP